MNAIIAAKNLNKYYGSFQALKDINFSIEPGQIVGLIGPNGAGKTSLLKAIFGLTNYQGSLEVAGFNPKKQRAKLMQRMCFIADVAILPRWLNVNNAIDFVEGVHPRFDRNKALEFIKKTDIPLTSKVKQLSKGMIVQLHLALVMAIDADILILDEPTLGLDILYRKEFYRRILNDYYHEKRTIVITTHQVEEIESLLTNLMIINKGELLINSSMEDYSKQFYQITVSSEQAAALEKFNPIASNKALGNVTFIFENIDKQKLIPFGEIITPSISDVFVAKVTGAKQ